MTPDLLRSIRISGHDNVAVLVTPGGGRPGDGTDQGIVLATAVPTGHKFALRDIGAGEAVVRYGEVIAHAAAPIPAGSHVAEAQLVLPPPPDLDALTFATRNAPLPPLDEEFSFDGYLNPDGSCGTRNVLAIATSVQCVAGVAEVAAERIRTRLLPDYPNVDDVVALNHAYGCGVAIDAPGSEIPIRTLQNLLRHPNFGGEALVVGLGCEKLQPGRLFESPDPDALPLERPERAVLSLQDPRFTGFEAMLDGILERARERLERLDRRRRQPCPLTGLVVGAQCGGSDSLSGVTANPVVGFAADLVVRAGGSVMFSEVSEVRDALHLLAPRVADESVGRDLAEQVRWFDDYLARGQIDRSANPTPGNKAGGLSNIVEKALGSVAKSGSGPIVDVLAPGQRLRRRGLNFAATPASDFVCGTLQLASGMNVHLFTTGRGTPYGLAAAPVIKITSNSELALRWHDLVDFDAGRVASGQLSVADAGWLLFRQIIDVASGREKVAADRLGLRNDLVLFNPAPIT